MPSKPDLPKTYDPAQFEKKIYDQWEKSGALRPSGRGEPWTVMMPPPNVTGRLHMGHALNMTLQDVLARFERMRGRDVLWQAGTDHAGIATQAVVEKQLAETSNQTRQEIGREAFLDRVWAWKQQSGDEILQQLRRLGASCDWQRARFTLDDGMSRAVRHAFVRLYADGLIYRDKRLVNWDISLKTAISDLEVVPREVNGHLWYVRYPLQEGAGDIIVATTRPETMLGDVAVAVHPDDARYQKLIGKKLRLPLVGRSLLVVADDYVDSKQGSGALKVTPAHDFNDFEIGKRHGLAMINILTADGCVVMEDFIPESYRGLTREAARARVVADLDAGGFLVKVEDHRHPVPYGDRSDVVIEPWLTDQWYVDAKKLAAAAMDAVRDRQTQFIPENWRKTYFDWLENIQPWCISRQLWWGHRIPIWYDEDGTPYAAMDEADAQNQAGAGVQLRQDEDVLDTWFSSALWPFSTLGWPDKTPDLERYFPTQILITGFDIIFFWVARMMMMSCYFMKQPPFAEVYIHALVRDRHGQKMTKSRGNVVDPLTLMDQYGADALRFTLIAMEAQGRDIKLSEARVAGYRNFATKLWNAARFCQMNDCVFDPDFDIRNVKLSTNRWIFIHLEQTRRDVDVALEICRFNEAAHEVYQFIWHVFCDRYLELAKLHLRGDDEAERTETRAAAAWVLREILRMLHPFMPFITEELWDDAVAPLLIKVNWYGDPMLPEVDVVSLDFGEAFGEIELLMAIVERVRSLREESNISSGDFISAEMEGSDLAIIGQLPALERLARIKFTIKIENRENCVGLTVGRAWLLLDIGKNSAKNLRLNLDKTSAEIVKLETKLKNREFTDKAPAEVVEENQTRLAKLRNKQSRLEKMFNQLS